MNRICLALAAALLLAALADTTSADILYLSDGDGFRIAAIDTTTASVVFAQPAVPRERAFPIAVMGDIRTTGYAPGESGGRYDLAGNSIGGPYTLPTLPVVGEALSDGTTDGTSNFGVSFEDGNVYRFDRAWASPTLQFAAGGSFGGITYDRTDDTFWLSADRASGISHFSRTGVLLGSFATPEVGPQDWDLALDPSDGTLWVGEYQTDTFHQYSKAGVHLGQIAVDALGLADMGSFYSGEFDLKIRPVPEPSGLVLLGLGVLGAAAATHRHAEGRPVDGRVAEGRREGSAPGILDCSRAEMP